METAASQNPLSGGLEGPRQRHSGGFALVVTISIMVLLALLGVGMLSLSTIAMRSGQRGEAMDVARSNARLALVLALGELQKHAGPDQRVTGSAVLGADDSSGRHLCSVWKTDDDGEGHLLVSGNEDGTLTPADQGDFPLVSASEDPGREVLVKTISVNGSNGEEGRYGWWVSDEGGKARVDLQAPEEEPSKDTAKFARARSPQETGVGHAASELAALSDDAIGDKRRLLSLESLSFPTDADVPKDFIHDLTTGGAGLPVNVVDGGMKTDLSIVFDSTQERSSMVSEVLGARPTSVSKGSGKLFSFSVSEPERFYFANQLTGSGQLPVGPNWGILYNYARLWENITSERSPVVPLDPAPETDLRKNEWPPYNNVNEGGNRRDTQHTNSPLQPVLGYLQMGLRMRAEGGKAYTYRGTTGSDGYQLQLEMKPVIGLWNPYNVKISSQDYRIDWALYPYFRLGVRDKENRLSVRRVWMREHWKSSNSSGSRWFQLRTSDIDLEPGEIRYFSVTSKTDLGNVNNLVPGWNEDGGFVFDLVHSSFDSSTSEAGQPIVFPPGSVSWYGDLFLEDTQHDDTEKHFGEETEGNSASWITLKGSGAIHRISDIWQTPRKGQATRQWKVPEQVLSPAVQTGVSSPRIRVEQLAEVPWHVGTWAWYARTSTEATSTQSARGWMDANIRYAAANPVWDGSEIDRRGIYKGWYFNSPMLGGSWGSPDQPYSKSVGNGDGGPGGRGKVAEGQLGEEEPQASGLRRYRGFGGPSRTASGQTHVTLFDVPRAPLVSLGQLQHAQLSRYNYEPSFVLGNSYASSRIPLDETLVPDFGNVSDFNMLDISYVVNEELWDGYFFSTIGADYFGGRRSLESVIPMEDLKSGELELPNPRYRFRPQAGDTTLDQIVKEGGSAGAREIAARISVEGAFNINSVSKTAWKALLSSLADFEMPVITTAGGRVSWEECPDIRLPRFGHVLSPSGWESGDSSSEASYWTGFRSLSEDELDDLAEAIVEEVQERGPFRSFADFVNRDPESDNADHQRKGALQAAIDRTINAKLPSSIGGDATKPTGSLFSEAVDGENESAGYPGYLTQGDLLQSLAPVLSPRSDYFRIRTVGEATDSNGNVTARAYAEAFVQREPDYVDPEDSVSVVTEELDSEVNRRFGRRFRITSFRWLNTEEI